MRSPLLALLVLAYFQRSRRYRVTFERRVRPDDPLLAPGRGRPSALPSARPPAMTAQPSPGQEE